MDQSLGHQQKVKPLQCKPVMIITTMCREPRQFSSPKNLRETISGFILSVKSNCTCSYLSVVTANDVTSTLHIVEMEGHQKISYPMNIGLDSNHIFGG